MFEVLNNFLVSAQSSGDMFQLIIYFGLHSIKPIHGKEIRSLCTDYLIDPLLDV
jgi:hypothetical protein